MEQRNILEWSEHSEYTELTIPSGEIWMSESELVDLFGVFIPKLRNIIQTLYKEELVRPYEAERTIRQERNLHLTVYNLEVVMLLAFCLNSYQARAVRRELMERISHEHKSFEVIMTAVKGERVIVNDKPRPMSDGSDFNAESGEPRKTLFGVEARLCFRNPKTALLHTPKGRVEGLAPMSLISEFSYYSENIQIIMNKPYCNIERTRPNSSSILGIFVNLHENISFLAINLLYLHSKRLNFGRRET